MKFWDTSAIVSLCVAVGRRFAMVPKANYGYVFGFLRCTFAKVRLEWLVSAHLGTATGR